MSILKSIQSLVHRALRGNKGPVRIGAVQQEYLYRSGPRKEGLYDLAKLVSINLPFMQGFHAQGDFAPMAAYMDQGGAVTEVLIVGPDLVWQRVRADHQRTIEAQEPLIVDDKPYPPDEIPLEWAMNLLVGELRRQYRAGNLRACAVWFHGRYQDGAVDIPPGPAYGNAIVGWTECSSGETVLDVTPYRESHLGTLSYASSVSVGRGPVVLVIPGKSEPSSRYQPGQVLTYHHRPHESGSRLIVQHVDRDPDLGNIVHVQVDRAEFRLPSHPQSTLSGIGHLAFSERAMDRSVIDCVEVVQVPDFQLAYIQWRIPFVMGKVGVITDSVADALDRVEQVLNNVSSRSDWDPSCVVQGVAPERMP